MLYWLTGTAHSAGRLYYEAEQTRGFVADARVEVPVGIAAFPKEIIRPPAALGGTAGTTCSAGPKCREEATSRRLRSRELLVGDVREFFRPLRVPVPLRSSA